MTSKESGSPTGNIVIYYHQLRPRIIRLVKVYESYFKQQGQQVLLMASSPSRSKDIEQLSAIRDSIDELVVMGGDGSVNIAAQVFAGSEVPISVIPLGTGNDFARDNRIRTWRWRLEEQIASRQVAIGLCGELYFVNHAGAGLTVDLIKLQQPWMKRVLGGMSYIIAILKYLFGPYERRSTVHNPSTDSWQDAQIVAVSRFIGGGIPIYPSAQRSQALLQWVGVARASRWQQLRALLAVLRGKLHQAKLIEVVEGTEFQLGDSVQQIELDGDCLTVGPQRIQVIPAGLTIYVPLP